MIQTDMIYTIKDKDLLDELDIAIHIPLYNAKDERIKLLISFSKEITNAWIPRDMRKKWEKILRLYIDSLLLISISAESNERKKFSTKIKNIILKNYQQELSINTIDLEEDKDTGINIAMNGAKHYSEIAMTKYIFRDGKTLCIADYI